MSVKSEKLFTHWIYINFELTSVLSSMTMELAPCYWLENMIVKCRIKSCYAPCAVSIMLPIFLRDASVVTLFMGEYCI